MKKYCLLLLILFTVHSLYAQNASTQRWTPNYPTPVEGDYQVKNFTFQSQEQLPEMNLHYTTIGQPTKGKDGKVNNAVLIMHGTTGNGAGFLNQRFAGHLFGSGQLLDATKYYIILVDGIGHGKSSKPSNGLHMRFPKYTYDDMVKAQYLLVTEHLQLDHLRLVMGTSMGGMHTWVWGYTYPDFMDALMPLASLPVEIAGRNRMTRIMAIDLIKMDPAWKGGEYTEQPKVGLTGAISSLFFMGSSPLQLQKNAPTREQAEAAYARTRSSYLTSLDANDFIYAFDASRYYNPAPHLEKIKAPLVAINSADDEVNPPELGLMEKEIKRVKNAKYVLLPITDQTSGHGTHSNPLVWGNYLKELLEKTKQ
ncbi:alpha/beta fold hydrolase [Sediminibacterium goheungense]|uniref:Homoserine O-acetyltransferase n=1 Tax=Sediminibacterium goheungense TaxID=1086393 RepID=A0A4R6ISJ8_9BACT|nr:alpha/beta fold hydrolase [Sediminibacterium goheungense]TDO25459.1 homoserine O-acetyltransferase [Sediminibacterium goheungense]